MTVRKGCCRSPGRRKVVPGGNKLCQAFEEGGATQMVWPINSTSGLKIVIRLTLQGQTKKFELFSFLEGGHCQGTVARWTLNQKDFIVKTIASNPQAFAPYAGKGIKLNELSTLCRQA